MIEAGPSATDPKLEGRVRLKAERGEFLSQLLLSARGATSDVQADFVDKLCAISSAVRKLFEDEGLIIRLHYEPRTFWPSRRGERVCFIDGGVARLDLPSAAPMGIRVGSYDVRLGDDTPARERFNVDLSIVDELFAAEGGAFDDAFDDTAKLTDAARIISEIAAVVRCAESADPPDLVLLHGPIVNPAAPYGTPGFPAFTADFCRTLCGDGFDGNEAVERHFMVVYLRLLERLKQLATVSLGVVERNLSKQATAVKHQLIRLVKDNRLKERSARSLIETIEEYRLNDASLLSVVLGEGECLKPIGIDRQEPKSKWPQDWAFHLEKYPEAFTTYLKSTEDTDPFRVESVREEFLSNDSLQMVFHTARLLPRYGFPVGLDIVDKYAKVPAWMSHGIQQQHAVALLNAAFRTGNPAAIQFAKKVVTARGRDWFFRPKA
jgi:hypothetical protein